jgi:hypothetical protein
VPKKAWGNLGGSLLNLSYGTGRAFIVTTQEVAGQWQGALCELPMPAFPTGIMRGRFAPSPLPRGEGKGEGQTSSSSPDNFDGALYTCGMYAWSGNAVGPGGFYRIRRNEEKPAYLPLAVHAMKGALRVTFSDPIDPASVNTDAFAFKIWSLKRTADYGSKHYEERPLEITAARTGAAARAVTLDIPALVPTHCYELKARLRGANGENIDRSLHGTIHRLGEVK